MNKNSVMILGKMPPPYQGTAVWMEIIRNSKLKESFFLDYVNTNLHTSLHSIGTFSLKKVLLNIRLYVQLYKKIKKVNPDLIHIPISQSTLGFLKDALFIGISRLCNKRIIVMLHGSAFLSWVENSSRGIKFFVRKTLNKTTGVIVLGEKLKYLFKDFYPEDRIFVVPNGIDILFPEIKKEYNQKICITYLGNLQSTKGIIPLVQAIKILMNLTKNDFCFKAIGNWRDDYTRNRCFEILGESLFNQAFIGPLYGKGKLSVLKQSDIFVFTPVAPEGHPFVIIEAMAAGLPIISSDQGAITESVFDTLNGFIVDPDRPDQIADKLKFLIENNEIREKMGKESQRIYKEKFTENNMVEALTYSYRKVLNTTD